MGLVTTDFLEAMMTGFRAVFADAFVKASDAADYRGLVLETKSTSDKEAYGWLGALPALSEWTDQRKLYGMTPFDYTVKNLNFEGTIQVDRNTMEDDQYGMISHRVMQLGQRAIDHMAKLVFDLLDAGASLKAFDGIEFFDTTRAIGESANIGNLLSGAYSESADEIRAGIAAGVAAMRNFEDDRGVPMNLCPDTLVCSPTLEILVKNALLPAVAGTTRAEAEIIRSIIVRPEIDADALDWYLLSTQKMGLKPLILQVRKPPEFVSVDRPDSHDVFMSRMLYYGIDWRGNVGYGDPRTAIKIVDNS
jgi:phage major head subunit gpT-like protein